MTCYRSLPHRLAHGLRKGLRLVPVMAATLSLAACQSYDTSGGNVVETLLFSAAVYDYFVSIQRQHTQQHPPTAATAHAGTVGLHSRVLTDHRR